MIRRTFTIVILFSMTLHCFSRLGVLSYVFEKRHDIAYSLGLIAEVPIAMCSSDYDFNAGLTVQEADDHQTLPQHFSHAQEITLFIHIQTIDVSPMNSTPVLPGFDFRNTGEYASPSLSVFHPPSVG